MNITSTATGKVEPSRVKSVESLLLTMIGKNGQLFRTKLPEWAIE